MNRFLGAVLCLLALVATAQAQQVDVALTISNGGDSLQLHVGLDPSATAGLDAALGEYELPPMPPTGVLEARFIDGAAGGSLGQGSYRDYRTGTTTLTGEVTHELQWQRKDDTPLWIDYTLPGGVTARLTDHYGGAVLDAALSGTGRLYVTNTALSRAQLTIVYSGTVGGVRFQSVPTTDVVVGQPYTYDVSASGDGPSITLTAPTLPAWLTLTDAGNGTGTLSGTPAAAGSYVVVLAADDGSSQAEQRFTIDVSTTSDQVTLRLTLRDGVDSASVQFGLDPAATAGLDAALGEYELPPMPPAGVLEARLVGEAIGVPLGQGTARDFRHGSPAFEGEQVHLLQLQPGTSGSPTLEYDLPERVTLAVDDQMGGAVLDTTLAGSGTLPLPTPAPDHLRLRALYSIAYPYEAPVLIAPAADADTVGTEVQLAWHAVPDAATYDVQLAADPLFAQPVDETTGLAATGHGVTTLSPMTHYYWRVRAVGPEGPGRWATGRFSTGPVTTPALSVPFTISDDIDSLRFHVGLAPSATDTLESALGEVELPPMPPAGTFEARLVGSQIGAPLGEGTYRDYRTGTAAFAGEVTHELQWQRGSDATGLWIDYALPEGVTARLEDFFGGVVLNETLADTGRVAVTSDALTQARLTMVYEGDGTANEAPHVARPLPDVTLRAGFGTYVVADLDTVFADANLPGDALTYHVTANADSIGTLLDGSILSLLSVAGIEEGSVAVQATARDTAQAEVTETFQVVLAPALVVALTAPADDAADLPTDASLRWSAVAAAASYDVRLATDEAMSQLVIDTTGVTTDTVGAPTLAPATTYYWQVRAHNGHGAGPWSAVWRFTTATPVGTDGLLEAPRSFRLHGAYPNPFNPSTQLTIDVPEAAHVRLDVYDALGRRVTTLVDTRLAPGTHRYRWNAAGHASGLYLARMEAGIYTSVQRVVLVK